MKGIVSSIFFIAIFSMFLTFMIHVDKFNDILKKSEKAFSNLRLIEDYYSYCSVKFRKEFPIKIRGNVIEYQNVSFEDPCNLTVDDNVILLNESYFIKFGDFIYISTNINSSYYEINIDDYFNLSCFSLPGSYRIIINSLNGTKYDNNVRYLTCSVNGTKGTIDIFFSESYFEEINGTLTSASPYLRVENPSRINFNIVIDKNLDNYEKEIMWKLVVEKDPYYYRGYVKWR